MTQPTTAEMVKELDAKFKGFADAFNHASSDDCACQYDRVIGYKGKRIVLNFVKFLGRRVQIGKKVFTANDFDTAITRAHDYFIVKGGEL